MEYVGVKIGGCDLQIGRLEDGATQLGDYAERRGKEL